MSTLLFILFVAFFLFSFYLPSNHTINLLLCTTTTVITTSTAVSIAMHTYVHTHIGRTILPFNPFKKNGSHGANAIAMIYVLHFVVHIMCSDLLVSCVIEPIVKRNAKIKNQTKKQKRNRERSKNGTVSRFVPPIKVNHLPKPRSMLN